MPPIIAEVQRREPQRNVQRGDGYFNARYPEGVYVSELTEPVRYTEFNDLGKPIERARASQQIALFTNVRGYFAVMRDSFTTPLFGPSPRAAFPKGRQAPYQERVNLNRTPAIAYGSLFSLGNSDPSRY